MSDDKPREWTLRELAAETGVTERTIRFYISRGLLDPPLRAGRDAAYGPAHKARLEAIRALQSRGMMLAEIAHALAGVEDRRPGAGAGRDAIESGGQVRRMVWFDMEGGIERTAGPEDAGQWRPAEGIARPVTLAAPETWRSYALAPDVAVMFRAGASPWRTKRLVAALRRFATEIEDGTDKEDTGE